MNEYEYQPLGEQASSFRLLRLKRGDSVKIECELFTAGLFGHDTVPYEALSYTWGSTELVETIKVDGRKLWITDNLYCALVYLRSRHQDRILWIDAICINQSDKQEQTQQVSQMGKIFSSATRVVFWLGKSTPEVTLLIESLNELQAKSVARSPENVLADSATLKMLWTSMQQMRKNCIDNRLRTGLEVLLKRPWFDRIWILQEVLNAQSAIVCSGALSVSAPVFALCPSLLGCSPTEHVRSVLNLMPTATKIDRRRDQERNDLMSLFRRFYACKATDERDMVFALLNLLSQPIHQLCPDYTKSIQEVIWNTVHYWLKDAAVRTSHIMHFLTRFDTIRVAYLVDLTSANVTSEMLQPWSHLGPFPFCKNTSLFLIDSLNERTGEQETFWDEVDRLEPIVNADGGDRPLQILRWQSTRMNIKILIVSRALGAIELVSQYSCSQILAFILKRISGYKQGLVDAATSRAACSGMWDAARVLLNVSANLNNRDGIGGDVLFVASFCGHLDIVRSLLKHGADANASAGKQGNAIWAASRYGHLEAVELLLEYGADVNARGENQGNAIWVASRYGHLKIVQLLLEHGADVNAGGGRRGNTIWVASANGHLGIVQLLLKHGADVNSRKKTNGSALQAAADRGHLEIVQLLLEDGADVSAHEQLHGTLIERATLSGRLDIVQLLLKHRADVNIKGRYGGSALGAAVFTGQKEMVKLLLDAGADVNFRGTDGTILDTAERFNIRLVPMLLDAGAIRGRHAETIRM